MADDTVTLEPCPFCGSASVGFKDHGLPDTQAGCNDCGAMTPWKRSRAEARTAWNTRIANRPAPDAGEAAESAAYLNEWANDIERNSGGHSVDALKLRSIASVIEALASLSQGRDAPDAGLVEYVGHPKLGTPDPSFSQGRDGLVEAELPRLDDGLIEAALVGHYGKKLTDNLGIDGVDLTVNDANYSFKQGFTRMWAGVRKELKRRAALREASQ